MNDYFRVLSYAGDKKPLMTNLWQRRQNANSWKIANA